MYRIPPYQYEESNLIKTEIGRLRPPSSQFGISEATCTLRLAEKEAMQQAAGVRGRGVFLAGNSLAAPVVAWVLGHGPAAAYATLLAPRSGNIFPRNAKEPRHTSEHTGTSTAPWCADVDLAS